MTSWENQRNLHYHYIFMTHFRMSVKHEMISGPSREISHTAITLNQESKSTGREKESFPIPMKNIDVTRGTHTTLDVMQEGHIDDYWNIDGLRDLSDSWTGFTHSPYWMKILQTKLCSPWWDWRNGKQHQGLGPEIWRIMSRSSKINDKQNWTS